LHTDTYSNMFTNVTTQVTNFTDPEAHIFAALTYQQLDRRQWRLVGMKLNNSS